VFFYILYILLYLNLKKYILLYLITPFIVIAAKPYFDEPGCNIHVDIIYYTLSVLVTTVFLKISTLVRNMYMQYILRKIKLTLSEVHFVGLHYVSISCLKDVSGIVSLHYSK